MSQPIDRRTFLRYSLATTAVWAGGGVTQALGLSEAQAELVFEQSASTNASAVFPQSVASGDPAPNGIVLWTRVVQQARRKLRRVNVGFEIATDAAFRQILLRGVAQTDVGRDYVVKAQINSPKLKPFTTYYYRFYFEGAVSRTGRFKTLPAANQDLQRLRFAFISCQDYTNGYYTALRYLAQEDLDFVVHLGDYIYETVRDESFQNGQVRPLTLPSGRDRAETLEDYRFLYKTYKTDPNLQRLQERFAFISIWDDHEFANDCYGAYDTDSSSPSENFDPQRRRDANRAWAEHTPIGIPVEAVQNAPLEMRIYRSFRFGQLMELVLTDERLYRDAQPCGVGTTDKYATPGCPERTNSNRTMLGRTQRDWFLDTVLNSKRTWKIWGNQVMVMQLKILNAYVGGLFPALPRRPVASDGIFLNLDQWDGYPVERARILSSIRNAGVKNFVTITGDIHTFMAGYQRVNFDNPLEAPVGTCFICGSVTSANLEELATFGVGGPVVPPMRDLGPALIASNPHLQYLNSSGHGYNIMEVTPQALTCTMKAVDNIKQPRANLYTLKVFRVPRDQVLIQDVTPLA